jgi:hypothetical protein
MVHHLRIQANALRQAAAESQTDPLLMTMMLETAGELEAFADQVEPTADGSLAAAPVAGDQRTTTMEANPQKVA